MQIKFKRLHKEAILPTYQSEGAAAFDLHALIDNQHGVVVVSNHMAGGFVFSTGWAVEIPKGYVGVIVGRSGHGFKNNVRLANCLGVIDCDYRGEVKVKLISDNPNNALRVQYGDRIAQMIILPAPQFELLEVDDLGDTERGTGGFGSTGEGLASHPLIQAQGSAIIPAEHQRAIGFPF